MKMSKFFLIGLLLLSQNIIYPIQSSANDEVTTQESFAKVEVYYFHFTKRCVTCQAVEDVTKEALKEFYGNRVTFTEYNLDEDTGKKKGEDLEISGQTLLIVSGESKVNLTNEGFMYARSNPDKLKQLIKEKVDSLL